VVAPLVALFTRPGAPREAIDGRRQVNGRRTQVEARTVRKQRMRWRTHLALGKDTPSTRLAAPPLAGRIVANPEVGGLHYRYERTVA
jgi:hypothetical protein